MMRDDRGSAFVEALVASAIVAMAVLVMLQSVSQTASRQSSLENRRVALLIAQSQLASVGSLIPLAPGDQSGSEGQFVWRVRIAPYQASGNSGTGGLMAVETSVALSGGRELVTLRSLAFAAGLGQSDAE
jgi:type II secretion system protein I